jgi:hypothetical protein
MFSFVLPGALFKFRAKRPAFAPLFQLPERRPALLLLSPLFKTFHPPAQHPADFFHGRNSEFVLPDRQKPQVLGQPEKNRQQVDFPARFVQKRRFVAAVIGLDYQFQKPDGAVFNPLAQNEPLGFGKFVDRWIQP